MTIATLWNCCRHLLIGIIVFIALSVSSPPDGLCREPDDSRLFLEGFTAYQNKEYSAASTRMEELLQKYPETPLRDMALFWLSHACFRNGRHQEAVQAMARLMEEYPGSRLDGAADERLLALTVSSRQDAAAKLLAAEREQLAADRESQERRAAAGQEALRVDSGRREQERGAADMLRCLSEEQRSLEKERQAARAAEQGRQEQFARELRDLTAAAPP